MSLELVIRPFEDADIAAALSVETAAFGEAWQPTAFVRELHENRLAHYLTLEEQGNGEPRLIGFGGIWDVVGEAHIVVVAVDPARQGTGLGSLLTLALLELAEEMGMENATLECRVSNAAARAVYRRLGFYEVGERRRYYGDGEDAVIMTTEAFTAPAMRERLAIERKRIEARAGPVRREPAPLS